MHVFIRNSFKYIDVIGYNLYENLCDFDFKADKKQKTCGGFIFDSEARVCGIVRPSILGINNEPARFFIRKNVYFFHDLSLSSTLKYYEDESACFILKQNDEVIENCTYSRKPNYPIPTFGIPQTEEENDMYFSIHSCLQSERRFIS